MHSNMMTRYGVVQAPKTAMVPVYPGGQQQVQWTINTSTNAQVAFFLTQKKTINTFSESQEERGVTQTEKEIQS